MFHVAFVARSNVVVDGTRVWTLFDDAMVSMRYARNLASGHGLAWNASGPRVEGYSNLLWTLVMAGVHAVGVPSHLAPLAVATLGVAIVVATMAAARGLFVDVVGSGRAPFDALVVLAVGLAYPFVFWTLRGMEVGLLALLLVVATRLAIRLTARAGVDRRDALLLGAVLAAAVLTRDDAAVLVAVIIGWLAWQLRRRVVTAWPVLVVPLLAAVVHTAFRVIYYGDPLPNTFYLKVSGIPIGYRLRDGLASLAPYWRGGLALATALAVYAVVRRRSAPLALVAGLVVAQSAYAVSVGGDAWEQYGYADRYVATVIPLLLVAAGVGAATLHGELGSRAALSTGALTVVGLLVLPNLPMVVWARDNARELDSFEPPRVAYAHVQERATTPDAVIAVSDAGLMPYLTDRPSVDLLGKSDATIAHEPPKVLGAPGHEKYDLVYSACTLRPDLIADAVDEGPAVRAAVLACGYDRLPYNGNVYVRHDSTKVDVPVLEAGLDTLVDRYPQLWSRERVS